MPNATNAASIAAHRILMLGDTGAGKTSQILTLPGRKYAYLFDSNALSSLKGYDVEYDEYLPDIVSAAVTSLTKGKGDSRSSVASDVYMKFEREFDERLKSGYFDSFDWICFDSLTTLSDLIMDRVLTINGRYGQWPQQDDYGPQMVAIQNLCRTANSLGKGIYMTGHLDVTQDKISKSVARVPMLTGRLRAKLPLLFSDIFYASAEADKDNKPHYLIQTFPAGLNTTIRTSIKGLSQYEDVTIDFTKKDLTNEGLGGLLNWERKQLNV